MAGADLFSLCWNDYQAKLSSGVRQMLEEEVLLDVTLGVDGNLVQAHKLVLSICSPYFKELFKVNPCKHPIVLLKDVEMKNLEAILQFMYKGEVNISQDDLPGFLKTAEMLKVSGLTGSQDKQTAVLPEDPYLPSTPVDSPTAIKRQIKHQSFSVNQEVMIKRNPSPSSLSESIMSPPPKRKRSDATIPFKSNRDCEEICVKMEPQPIEIIDDDDDDDDDHHHHDNACKNVEDGQLDTRDDEDTREMLPLDFDEESHMNANSRISVHPEGMINLPESSQEGNIQYVYSKKGKTQLVYDGNLFHLHYNSEYLTSWKCTSYWKSKCKAQVQVLKNGTLRACGHHNHAMPTHEIERKLELKWFSRTSVK